MAIKLSVNRLSPDKMIGHAADLDMINNNNFLSKSLISKYPNQTQQLYKAGRYMALFFVLSEGQYGMMYVDFAKNKQAAELAFDKLLKEESQKELFMSIFDEICANYEKDYNEVELFIDESFPNPFLSNN